ncbi:MAG: helix-turn-helix transcriptional regulator [Nocardioides sp.]
MQTSALLALARRRAGISQAELARRAGTSQPDVSVYERGLRDPGTATLRRLVAATGHRLELGLGAAGSDLPPALDDQERSDRLVDVLGLADALPARARHRALDAPRMRSR